MVERLVDTGFEDVRPAADETLDSICGGRVRLIQRARGYRFTLDPVLLAHFAAQEGLRGPLIDLGTGSGVIPLILARRFDATEVTGLELQPPLYEIARRNVRLNGCEERVSLALGDLRSVQRMFPRQSFTHVVANPPYKRALSGHRNPDPEKAIARHEIHCGVNDLADASAWLLRERGTLHVIYPAARLAELLSTLRARELEPRKLRLVHTRGHRPARLCLVTAVKGGAPDLEVQPPLIVHPDDRPGFSAEVEAMVRC